MAAGAYVDPEGGWGPTARLDKILTDLGYSYRRERGPIGGGEWRTLFILADPPPADDT
jgi:hypothetical protein